jgi:hypothetical protein
MNESVSARVYLGDAAVGTMGTPPDIDYVGYTNASWTWTPPASGSATVLHLGFPWMVPQGGGAPLPYAGAVQCFVIHPVITANQWVEIPTVNHDQFQHIINYNNKYVSSIYIPSTFDISSVSYSIPNDFVALKFVVDGHELKLPGTGW